MSCCLALILASLSSAAHAAGWMPVIYDPWEYEISSDVDGDYRIVKFAIPVENPVTMAWLYDNGSDAGSKKMWGPSNGFAWDSNVDRFLIRTFYLGGGVSWVNSAVNGSVLSVKDLKQSSTFCLTGTYGVDLALSSAPGTLSAHAMLFVYDSEGNWITSYTGQEYTYDVPVGTHNFGYTLTFKNYLPNNAAYIVPYLQILFEYDDSVIAATGGSISVYYPDDWTFEVPINMVLENTQTMYAIKDKLGDISDQLGDLNDKQDQTNDKLDEIISGGEIGEQLGGAGAQLEGSSGDVSDIAGDVSGDIGSVQDFESNLMGDIDGSIDQIDVITGVGGFNTSLAFVSGLAQGIFDGVSDWQVALTLPLFLGLFFGICQHVGGVSNMRARHAREARNEELHQARLDKIRNGGKK